MFDYRIIEGTAARRMDDRTTTPEGLAQTLRRYRHAAPARVLEETPLSLPYQKVLLDHSHYLSARARRTLLLRLARDRRYYEPLFYELCESSDEGTLREARAAARERRNSRAAALLSDFLGDDERPDLRTRAVEWLLGLAY
jgi:hypothetical protein